jgi:hypothetical protein
MSPPCDNATFYPTTETQIAPNILLDGLLGQLVKHADTENLLGPIDSSCSFVIAVSTHMEVFYRVSSTECLLQSPSQRFALLLILARMENNLVFRLSIHRPDLLSSQDMGRKNASAEAADSHNVQMATPGDGQLSGLPTK